MHSRREINGELGHHVPCFSTPQLSLVHQPETVFGPFTGQGPKSFDALGLIDANVTLTIVM